MPKNNLSIIDNLRNTIDLDKNEHSTLADVIDSINNREREEYENRN